VSAERLLGHDWRLLAARQPMGQHDRGQPEGRRCGEAWADSCGHVLVRMQLECELRQTIQQFLYQRHQTFAYKVKGAMPLPEHRRVLISLT